MFTGEQLTEVDDGLDICMFFSVVNVCDDKIYLSGFNIGNVHSLGKRLFYHIYIIIHITMMKNYFVKDGWIFF